MAESDGVTDAFICAVLIVLSLLELLGFCAYAAFELDGLVARLYSQRTITTFYLLTFEERWTSKISPQVRHYNSKAPRMPYRLPIPFVPRSYSTESQHQRRKQYPRQAATRPSSHPIPPRQSSLLRE
jgi:hypothetical protein